jgi:UDP-N-acetyl-D-glucosamine dehydrogenase
VSSVVVDGMTLSSLPLLPAVSNADCVMIVTGHARFDYDAVLREAALIIDTRNAFGYIQSEKVIRL